jgi:hypothetical protein
MSNWEMIQLTNSTFKLSNGQLNRNGKSDVFGDLKKNGASNIKAVF